MVEAYIAGTVAALIWAWVLYEIGREARLWLGLWRQHRAHQRLLDELWNDGPGAADDELARSA